MDTVHAPPPVRQSICSRDFWTASRCYRCTAFFVIISVVTLILLGIFVVAPAMDGLSLKPATCTVISSEITGTQSCRCGKGCSSSYPCLKVYVHYIPKEHKERNMSNVVLHETVFEGNVEDQCSIAPCESNKDYNKDKVKDFQNSRGKEGQEYLCYYNDEEPKKVFLKIDDYKMAILHSILWPMLLILLMFCIMCGVYVHQKRSSPQSFSY